MNIKINGTAIRTPDHLKEKKDSGVIDKVITYKLDLVRGESTKSEKLNSSKYDLSEIEFEDGTTWIGDVDDLPALFDPNLTRDGNSDDFIIPNQVTHSNSRSITDVIKLKTISLFKTKIAKKTALQLAKSIDKYKIASPGLKRIDDSFSFPDSDIVKASNSDPYLLFIHGTLSSTTGSFQDLFDSVDTWPSLQKQYGQRILALEHHTLSMSPLENAKELIEQLPDEANLHLITHSRGGIIGDIMAKCDSNHEGFTQMDVDLLSDANRTKDLKHIEDIKQLRKKKSFTVSNYIRVACPAAGTSILTGKIDVLLNVLSNLTTFVGKTSLIAGEIGDLIVQILKQKSDPNVIPGLEAMIPGTAFQNMMNNHIIQLDSPLSIVYSNSSLRGGVLKSLAYLLSRLTFGRDNDFVVDLNSMFYGVPRKKPIRGLEVINKKVCHMNYFSMDDLRSSLLSELSLDYEHSKFKEKSMSDADRGIGGLPGGRLKQPAITGKKPIVILIPGIMGSVLSRNKGVMWLDYPDLAMNGIQELAFSQNGTNGKVKTEIKATHLIESSYAKLVNHLLAENYEVMCFPYDWRKSLKSEGDKLSLEIAKLLNKEVEMEGGKKPFDLPIKILAHSMGGLLVRDLMIRHSNVYNQLSKRPGYKFVMLGTPWRGSYMIMQFLTGQGKRFQSLNKLTFLESKEKLLSTVSQFPGVIDLLPIDPTIDSHEFGKEKWWKEQKAKSKEAVWSTPPPQALSEWSSYTKEAKKVKLDRENVYYIAGKADHTVDNFKIPRKGGIQYRGTPKGDGSVTWDSGIPKELQSSNGEQRSNPNVYYVDVVHGELANDVSLFTGIVDLMRFGKVINKKEFSEAPLSVVSLRSNLPIPETPIVPNNTEDLWSVLLGGEVNVDSQSVEDDREISIRFTCADLKESMYPVMVGHQNGTNLKGSEKAANDQMGNKLEYLLQLGLYPNAHGMCEVLLTNKQTFKGVIAIGTGPKEIQTGFTLVRAVEKAILKYVYTVDESIYATQLITNNQLKISSVLISSYYGGLSVEESLQSILKGINRANQLLRENEKELWVSEVEFIEIYEDRCDQALLKMIKVQNQESLDFKVNIVKKVVQKDGARLSLPTDHDDDWYKRYSIEANEVGKDEADLLQGLTFKASGGLASENIVQDYSNRHVIESLIKGIPEQQWNPELSKALFELLIPNDFKTNFKRHSNILLVVDKETAKFPWEMLAADLNETEPIAVNASIIRQFSSEDALVNPTHINSNTAFIIGNPDTQGKLHDLPSAKMETDTVNKLLVNSGYTCFYQDAKDMSAKDYIIKLMAHEYKIIHISAHGIYDGKNQFSKIMLGPEDSDVLTPADLCKMSYTPELAFINCCHLGTIEGGKKELVKDRYKIAASIGEELLNKGYRAVIVAGWAIHDDAARVFAEEFYTRFLRGVEFGRAVMEARKICYQKYKTSNTWGAYHCYGDPEYRLVTKLGSSSGNGKFYVKQEIKIALRKFKNSIKGKRRKENDWVIELAEISKRIQESNFAHDPDIQELEAEAYESINEWDRAINLYSALFEGEKTNYTFKCYERFLNISVRNEYKKGRDESNKTKHIKNIETCIKRLTNLIEAGNTAERQNLIGSAYKRLFILKPNKTNLKQVIKHFGNGLSMTGVDGNYYYPLIQLLKASYFLNGKKLQDKHIFKAFSSGDKHRDLMDALNDELNSIRNSNSFWDEIAMVNLHQYDLLTGHQKDVKSNFKRMKQIFGDAWDIGGTFKEKSTEIEHVDFLITGMKFLNTSKSDERLRSLYKFKEFLDAQE